MSHIRAFACYLTHSSQLLWDIVFIKQTQNLSFWDMINLSEWHLQWATGRWLHLTLNPKAKLCMGEPFPTERCKTWVNVQLKLPSEGEGSSRWWGVWMASLSEWTWVWANSRRWWRAGRPGGLHSMESQRVGHDWATEQQLPPGYVLNCQSYYNKVLSTGWLINKRHLFFLWFWRLEVQGQGPADLEYDEGLQSHRQHFSYCVFTWQRWMELSGVPFIRAPIPLMKAPLSWPRHLPKGPTL